MNPILTPFVLLGFLLVRMGIPIAAIILLGKVIDRIIPQE